MVDLATKYDDTEDTLLERVLNQMARELLLLQSSDWLFIITNKTMVEYAHKKIKEHTGRFNELYEQIKRDDIDLEYLEDLEEKDSIFPYIDFRVYSKKNK